MRPPAPPFTEEAARAEAQAAEDACAIDESERRIFGPRPDSERGAPLALA